MKLARVEIAKTKERTIHTGVPMLAEQMNLMLRFMLAQNEGDSL